MNCQEVMEYMQRELDGDLGEIESAKLREHIRHCADCAAMYERLKRLSAELENLPKVTPPFSLVDAILPKLDEIDRAAAGGGPEAAQPQPPDRAAAPTAAPRRRNSRFNLRVLGGVVAAGIVAGIFLVNYDRDPLIDGYSGDGTGMELSSGSSGFSGSSEVMSMVSSADETFKVSEYDSSLQDSANLAATRDSASSAPEAEPSAGTVRKSPSGREDEGGADAGAGSGSTPATGPGTDAGSGSDAGSGVIPDRNTQPELPQAGPEEGISVAEGPAERLEESAQWGIAGFLEDTVSVPVESVSPDGSYIAVFADSRVIIRDAEGNTRFESEPRPGAISAMGWSEDGAFFRYEIRLEDGAAEIYRIDPAEGTETMETGGP